MEYYILLFNFSAIIVFLAAVIWRKTRNLSFIIGIFLLYYFSIFGAWFFIYDSLSGGKGAEFGLHYYYLFGKMFFVHLDEDYFLTIVFYSLFIIIIEVVIILLLKSSNNYKSINASSVKLSPFRIILLTSLCLFASIYLIKDHITEAILMNKSAYIMTRTGGAVSFYTIHAFLNRAIIPMVLGFSIYISGENGIFIYCKRNIFLTILYTGALVIWVGYLAIIGNRNELLTSMIIGFLFYLVNDPSPKRIVFIISAGLSIIILYSIGMLRGTSPLNYIDKIDIAEIIFSSFSIFLSNEMFAAHFSLYGVLHYNVPLVPGYSIYSLLMSIVPQFIWEQRPPTIYAHYASGLDVIMGQGYTIHHATGWYLNFWYFGIFMGGIVLGIVWVWCFNKFITINIKKRNLAFYLFSAFAPWLFVGGISPLIRGGLENYKGVFTEQFILPIVMILLSCFRIRKLKFTGLVNAIGNNNRIRILLNSKFAEKWLN